MIACRVLLVGFAVSMGHVVAQAKPDEAMKPAKVSHYLTGISLNFAALVVPPPAPGSAEAQADLAAVHLAQTKRSAEQVKDAQRDDHEESIFAYETVLGPGFRASELPVTAALSLRLRAESSVINPVLKSSFHRPRPFVADTSVNPVCDKTASESYPSGHAMVGYLEGLALAQMIPERSQAILERAKQYAQNRVVCGVHYPSDVEASHSIALAMFGELATSARFQQDLQAARSEIRKQLKLNP